MEKDQDYKTRTDGCENNNRYKLQIYDLPHTKKQLDISELLNTHYKTNVIAI